MKEKYAQYKNCMAESTISNVRLYIYIANGTICIIILIPFCTRRRWRKIKMLEYISFFITKIIIDVHLNIFNVHLLLRVPKGIIYVMMYIYIYIYIYTKINTCTHPHKRLYETTETLNHNVSS